MVERVWVGNLGSSYGMKISKPGHAVGSAADENLLLDTTSAYSRILQMGQLTFSAGGVITQTATIPSIGGSVPVVIFRYVEVFSGSIYAFPLYRNETNTFSNTSNISNGWTASCTGTTISVTRNYSFSSTQYVYYLAFALPV